MDRCCREIIVAQTVTLITKRLHLRPWKTEDLAPFAQLNVDPRVMEYFPKILTPEESNQLAKRIQDKIEAQGYGFWAASLIESGEFIGFIGLNPLTKVDFLAPFAPAVEVGWRLAFDHWGKGYATESALAALKYGFETLKLDEIVAFTVPKNMRSRRVMERLGMHYNPADDFDHPKLSQEDKLCRHVLYRIRRDE